MSAIFRVKILVYCIYLSIGVLTLDGDGDIMLFRKVPHILTENAISELRKIRIGQID